MHLSASDHIEPLGSWTLQSGPRWPKVSPSSCRASFQQIRPFHKFSQEMHGTNGAESTEYQGTQQPHAIYWIEG